VLRHLSDPCERPKKIIPVVPVSYLEKIRVGTSEINIFFKYFFHSFGFFAGRFAVVSTSILTRDAYFLWTNLGNLVQ
jgi:hypothetical protein